MAADKGHHKAQTMVGNYYAEGVGIKRDKKSAYAYYSLAGTTDQVALSNLNTLKESMTEKEISDAQVMAFALKGEIEAYMASVKAGN